MRSSEPRTRHSASSAVVAAAEVFSPVRRSLGSALEKAEDNNDSLQKLVPALNDEALQANLSEYIKRFGNLQKKLAQARK